MKPSLPAAMVVVGVFLAGEGCDRPTALDTQDEVAQACAQDDLTSKAVLYFGPSNHIGPGSVWSRLGSDGGYQPRWRVQDLGIDESVIGKGEGFSCNVGANSLFTADLGLAVLSKAALASADIKADFARAVSIKVTVDKVAWDTLIAGPYLNAIDSLEDGPAKSDVLTGNRLVLRRALRVNGYKAFLKFDTAVEPEIKAKYNGVMLGAHAVGKVGAQLSASWSSDGMLELYAPSKVYVAGEFAEMIDGEFFASRGETSSRVPDLGNKRIVPYAGEAR